ncbi:hypothetical protein ACLI34_28830, partial [Pseudomonas aeruginosa]
SLADSDTRQTAVIGSPGAAGLVSLKSKQYLHACGLAAVTVPDRIELVPAFPQTGIGKISKEDLRERLRR